MPPSRNRETRSRNRENLPRIAITVGDVGGVGPELAIRCAGMPAVTQQCIPILLGPARVVEKIAQHVALAAPADLVDVGEVEPADVHPGRFSAETGRASYQAVIAGIDAVLAGEYDALVTGPIQKEAWHAAGLQYPGHTELLAERTGAGECSMMLTSESISCVLVTVHIPLADVPSRLSIPAVLRAIRHADQAARRRGRPGHIVVCGLNPHAGERGLISHGEEAEIISPAIEMAVREGIDAVGPLPPDTAFTPAQRKGTDVYVCMYHDQGLIPLKALAFDTAVNVTLGLPIVRTSVDHGTALDLAWQGVANHQSMLAAIEMAIELC